MKKLTALILALSVGALPLQSAMAGIAGTVSSHGEEVHHMASHAQGSPVMDATDMADECDCCADSSCQHQSYCESAQCGYCVPALLAPASLPEIIADSIHSVESPQPAQRLPAGLFRPPRV